MLSCNGHREGGSVGYGCWVIYGYPFIKLGVYTVSSQPPLPWMGRHNDQRQYKNIKMILIQIRHIN